MMSQTREEGPLRKASGNRCCGLAGGESREVTPGLECRGRAVTGQCSYGREGMRSESKKRPELLLEVSLYSVGSGSHVGFVKGCLRKLICS